MQAESFCRICEEDEPHRLLLLIAISKGSGTQSMFAELTNPIGGSTFDSPGLVSIASYPGLICSVGHNAIGVALF